MQSPRFARQGRFFHRSRRRWVATVCLVLLAGSAAALACDTPVNRFALYNWEPADFAVYYLTAGAEDPLDNETNRVLAELAQRETPRPNVLFRQYAISADTEQANLPPALVAWRDENPQATLPAHVVLTPHDEVLSDTLLTADDVQALIDSPGRRRAAELLDEGAAGVLLLLTTGDEARDAQAREVIQKIVARAAAGEIQPGATRLVEVIDFSTADDRALEVGVVEVARADPAESWLVKMLLSIEKDLRGLEEPMVFGIYGRGRAMPPYVGAGIEVENLAGLVGFMNGACSCEVKEQNPGMDLLTTWDWDQTAELIAQTIGEEQGNSQYLAGEDLLSSIVILSSDDTKASRRARQQSASDDDRAPAAKLAQGDDSHGTAPAAASVDDASVPKAATADRGEESVGSRLVSTALLLAGCVVVGVVVLSVVILRAR